MRTMDSISPNVQMNSAKPTSERATDWRLTALLMSTMPAMVPTIEPSMYSKTLRDIHMRNAGVETILTPRLITQKPRKIKPAMMRLYRRGLMGRAACSSALIGEMSRWISFISIPFTRRSSHCTHVQGPRRHEPDLFTVAAWYADEASRS